MAYTEIKQRNNKKYYYRVISLREEKKVNKRRIYLGADLSESILKNKVAEADRRFGSDKVQKNLLRIKGKILQVLSKYRVKKAGIFGSYARGEQRKNSDIDIIIEPPKGIGLGFVGIAYELEDRLGKKVDLVTYGGISPYFKKFILESEVRIL